ncbi:MAG TPA: SDR family NAD(P)-dependent oxidoreductase [Nitrososphaerales archaeon]|nr:SDR family NAD(P)-dependent oxidoreductase [Nitrososphaerales archaeon]
MRKVSRALVTGGAGFIGSHIVDELLRRGVETLVVDDFSTGSPDNLRQHAGNKLLKVHTGDVRRVGEVLRGAGEIDVVFHEAAIASVPISVEQPMRVHDTNVNATLELMNFCLNAKVRRLVFASSAAVYGVIHGRASETNPCHPSSPYGASKLAVEDYLSAYHATYGLETVALRYFNVYGPRQRFNNGYSGVITIFANRLLEGLRPTVFGDGRQTRDFVNVGDIVRANMLAAESPAAVGERFNVASGRSVSILELLESLKAVSGRRDVRPIFAPPRRGDVRGGSASIRKIKVSLGYRPAVRLPDGLSTLLEQIKDGPKVAVRAS